MWLWNEHIRVRFGSYIVSYDYFCDSLFPSYLVSFDKPDFKSNHKQSCPTSLHSILGYFYCLYMFVCYFSRKTSYLILPYSPLPFFQTPLKVWTMYGPMAKWIWLCVPVNHKVASRDYSNESCDRPKAGGWGWWLFLGWCKKCVCFWIYLRWVVELGEMETWSPTIDSSVGCIKTCCNTFTLI